MKTKLLISFFLFISSVTIGQTNVIQVRKVTYDTSFYTKTVYDTTIKIVGERMNIFPILNQNKNGLWDKNVFFDDDSLFVFTKSIKRRWRNVALKNPEKFWKRINRKKRKNKCNVYAIDYDFYEILTTYQTDSITTTHYQIRNNSTNEIMKNEDLIILNDTSSTRKVLSNYWFVSEYDSILVTSLDEDNDLCGGRGNFNGCQFSSLTYGLKNHYSRNRAFGLYRYSGKINDKRCKMFLNFESHLIRKAIIIENNKTRFYCDFDVEQDSLFVFNAPFGEIHTGKVARKKNKIRFRNDRKNYTFYKKRNYYYAQYYYTYPVAD